MLSLGTSKYVSVLIVISLVTMALILQSCAGSKKWSRDIEGPIIFGSFGGFVGSFDEYSIHQDGSVYYRKALKGESSKIDQLDEELKKSIFQKIKSEEIFKEQMDQPGNLTYYLKFTYKAEAYHIQWGGQDDPSAKLLEYYNFLKSHINGKSPKM